MKKIALIAPPILKSQTDLTSYLSVPPVGYGGVENVMYALINGLIHHGMEVVLLGAPGSRSIEKVRVIRNARTPHEIRLWLLNNRDSYDVIHDHSCGIVFNFSHVPDHSVPYVATHHQTGETPYPRNTIYLSFAQKRQAGGNPQSPVIRIPVILDDYIFKEKKDDYYLFLGRISEWKGALEAVRLCKRMNARLIMAGPAWEKNYFDKVKAEAGDKFEYIGEVAGLKRLDLISKAKALMVISRPTPSPWGGLWCEPGSTIVSEAAASGTPVIASSNGCLQEIVFPETGIILTEREIEEIDTDRFSKSLFRPESIRDRARTEWDYREIAKLYIEAYGRARNGF